MKKESLSQKFGAYITDADLNNTESIEILGRIAAARHKSDYFTSSANEKKFLREVYLSIRQGRTLSSGKLEHLDFVIKHVDRDEKMARRFAARGDVAKQALVDAFDAKKEDKKVFDIPFYATGSFWNEKQANGPRTLTVKKFSAGTPYLMPPKKSTGY